MTMPMAIQVLPPSSPSRLPSVASVSAQPAPLPINYERACAALAECDSVDECKEWADKAAAVASYARQAHDRTMEKTAHRIRLRANRALGEQLNKIPDGRVPKAQKKGGRAGKFAIARAAGLNDRQTHTALRIANIPAEQFEKQVESENPPSLNALDQQGKALKPYVAVDKAGIDLIDHNIARKAASELRSFYGFSGGAHLPQIARGVLPDDIPEMLEHIAGCQAFLKRFAEALKGAQARRAR